MGHRLTVVFLTAKIEEWHVGEEDEIQFDDNGVDGEDADDVRLTELNIEYYIY